MLCSGGHEPENNPRFLLRTLYKELTVGSMVPGSNPARELQNRIDGNHAPAGSL